MKKFLLLLIAFSTYSSIILAQNVGIGTNNPKAKLDVNGRINLGNDTTNINAGDIRYHNGAGDFEDYDGERWYSLTGKRDVLFSAELTGADSYKMTTDVNNPIYVSDSSAFIYDDGGPLGDCSFNLMEIYIVNNTPTKAVEVQLYIENGSNGTDIYIDDVYEYVNGNESITISRRYPSDTMRIYTGNSFFCSDFKISYQFVYSNTQNKPIPQGILPLTFVEEEIAIIGMLEQLSERVEALENQQ